MKSEEFIVRKYVENKLSKIQELEPYIEESTILWTGNDPGLVWDLMILLPDGLYKFEFSHLWSEYFVVDDHEHIPPVFTRVKNFEWLKEDFSRRLPVALWIYQSSLVLQDKNGKFSEILQKQKKVFTEKIPEILRQKYLEFRTERHNLRHALERKNIVAVTLIKAAVVKLALELGFLAERKPYPYRKWLPLAIQYEISDGKKLFQISEDFLNVNDPIVTIELSERLVGEITTLIAKTEMFSEDFLRKWWLYLK